MGLPDPGALSITTSQYCLLSLFQGCWGLWLPVAQTRVSFWVPSSLTKHSSPKTCLGILLSEFWPLNHGR